MINRNRLAGLGRNGWVRRAAVALGLTAVLAVLLVLTIGGRPGSYSTHARTRGLDVVFDAPSISAWRLEDVTLCLRDAGGRTAPGPGVSRASRLCDPKLYTVVGFENAQEFTWAPGTHLQISRVGYDTPLEIDVIAAGAEPVLLGGYAVTANSRLIIENEEWHEGSTMTLEGQVTLGDTPGSGSQFNVIEGKYSISEWPLWHNTPVEVVSGVLGAGDVVQMVDFVAGKDVPQRANVFGFIGPAGKDEAGFLATLFSPLGQSQLQIDRYGAIRLYVQPGATDRALRNPLLLALGVFVAVMGGVALAVQLLRWIWFGVGKEKSA